MSRFIIILPFIFSFTLNAQNKFSIRDVNAKGYFQIENVSSISMDEWLRLPKDNNFEFQYFDKNSVDRNNFYYNYSDANASIALNISIFPNKTFEATPKLFAHWQLSLMFVRERLSSNSFSQTKNDGTEIRENSLYMDYVNNMARIEVMRLWRTDDTKKAFVAFGLGGQFGIAYDSGLEIYESSSSANGFNFNDFNSSFTTIESKNAMSNLFFLPIDVNVKVVENLFIQLELRTGIKHLLVFDGPSFMYPVYGIGIGTRYVL
ncbi:hypothetical protein HZR84_13335 [Hyphobacterium sp. CCMP332]|nr:hypothetical protein HZR84_13335 [Hyphobacterium sp. CCMP332]